MMDKKFDLLDRLREEAEKQNLPITLSMGIAYGQDLLDEIGAEAQNNLDVALVRGATKLSSKRCVKERNRSITVEDQQKQ